MSTQAVYSAAYSSKAEKYARYRWDYAPAAIETILRETRLPAAAWVADLGAGTGILTQHFVGRAARIYAVEPNAEMRAEAQKRLGSAGVIFLGDAAERTSLPDHSIDLVTVAQAIHWFDPEPARREILRILKPGGWLALIHNVDAEPDPARAHALDPIMTPEYGVRFSAGSPYPRQPAGFYYRAGQYQQYSFPFTLWADWEAFLGSLCSASYVPDESDALFPRFAAAARRVFDQFAQDGRVQTIGKTELVLGEPGA